MRVLLHTLPPGSRFQRGGYVCEIAQQCGEMTDVRVVQGPPDEHLDDDPAYELPLDLIQVNSESLVEVLTAVG